MSLHAVILAGGSGTRFWPLSRASKPKQFLSLVTERALIAETFLRIEPLTGPARIWTVCGKAHAEGVRALLPALKPEHLIVEPAARNTAPAIALACARVLAEDPDALLAILPSDHHIQDPAAFRAVIERAAQAAASGDLVTIGIQPTRAETGYGYLRRGERLSTGAYRVAAFVEKPDAITAERYFRDAAYSWNAGIFVFQARAMLQAIEKHLPEVVSAISGSFADSPSISIDYGVMEKEKRIALVPGDFGWSDVGSFAALPEVRPLDASGNVVAGEALTIDCSGCVVLSSGDRLVTALGLREICIIDTGDALLVMPRDRSQDVRSIVEALQRSGHADKS